MCSVGNWGHRVARGPPLSVLHLRKFDRLTSVHCYFQHEPVAPTLRDYVLAKRLQLVTCARMYSNVETMTHLEYPALPMSDISLPWTLAA